MYIQKVVLNFSFEDQLGNWSVPAEKGGKMENLEEIPLAEAWQELLTNLTHMWYQVLESNPGHSGGRQVLSLLHNPF